MGFSLSSSSVASSVGSSLAVGSSLIASSGIIKMPEYISPDKLGQAWVDTIERKLRREMDKNHNLEK